MRVAGQVQAQTAEQLHRCHILQALPAGFYRVDFVVQGGHVLQFFFGQAVPALCRVELVQVVQHRLPVVQQVKGLCSLAPAEDLKARGVPLFLAHLAHGVHDSHGIFPLVFIICTADAGQLRDLFHVSGVDLGHDGGQVFQVCARGFHRACVLLDRGHVRVPEARQVHQVVTSRRQVYHVRPYIGYCALHGRQHPGEDPFDAVADASADVCQAADGVRRALAGHGGHVGVRLHGLEAVANALQVVSHVGQGGAGVIQLLFPLGYFVLVVFVFISDFVQRVFVGLYDFLLLRNLLLQALHLDRVFLLGGGVLSQFSRFGFQFALQDSQCPVCVIKRFFIFFLSVKLYFLLDFVFICRHACSSPFLLVSLFLRPSGRWFLCHSQNGSCTYRGSSPASAAWLPIC